MRFGDETFKCLTPIYEKNYVGTDQPKTSQYYYNAFANHYFRSNKLDSVRYYVGLSLQCDSLMNDSFLTGVDIGILGSIALTEKDYDKAILHYLHSLQLIDQKKHPTNYGAILNNVGVAYLKKGYLETALYYFKKNLEIKDTRQNDYAEEARQVLKINIGIILRKQGSLTEALQLFHEVLDTSINENLIYPQYLANSNLSHTYLLLNNLDKAGEYLNKLQKLIDIHHFDKENYFNWMAELHFLKNNPGEMVRFLDSLEVFFKTNILEPSYSYYFLRGQAFSKNNNFSESQQYFEKAYSSTMTDSLSEDRIETIRELSKIYNKQGYYKKSAELLEKGMAEQTKIREKNNSINIADMLTKYQVDKYQLQLAKSNTEKTLLLQKNKSNTQLLYFSLLSILFLLITFHLYHRNSKNKRLALEAEKLRLEELQTHREKELEWQKRQLIDKRLHFDKLKNTMLEVASKYAGNERLLNRKLHLAFTESTRNFASFQKEFDLLYPDFARKILATNPNMTTRQLEYCMLISLGLQNKEVASILFVTEKTVEKTRSRLLEIFNLPPSASLATFLRNNLLQSAATSSSNS